MKRKEKDKRQEQEDTSKRQKKVEDERQEDQENIDEAECIGEDIDKNIVKSMVLSSMENIGELIEELNTLGNLTTPLTIQQIEGSKFFIATKHIKNLNASCLALSSLNEMIVLAKITAMLPNVLILNISNNNLGSYGLQDSDFEVLGQELAKSPTLTTLDIRDNDLDECCVVFVREITKSFSLHKIFIQGNYAIQYSDEIMEPIIAHNQKVQNFNSVMMSTPRFGGHSNEGYVQMPGELIKLIGDYAGCYSNHIEVEMIE